MSISVIVSNFTALATAAGAAPARAGAGLAASFAELLADELRQPPAPLPPQLPVPPPVPVPQPYIWLPVPVAVPYVRQDKSLKKRLPPRDDRRQSRR